MQHRPFTPEDIVNVQWLSDPQISPDGRSVAFVVTRMDGEADEYRSQVWLMATDGASEPRQLTFGPKHDSMPRWSPDGQTLAFLSDRGGKAQVWLLPADGGEANWAQQLTDIPAGVSYYAWSLDSLRLAVVSLVGDEEQKPLMREITALKYKHDGEGFRDGRKHIFVVDVESGEAKQVSDGDWDDTYPCWSPDGSQIAFASARHETRDIDSIADIWVVGADGGEARHVTTSSGPATMPVWSPDGRNIAFLGHDDPHANLAKNYGVWLVATEGGTPQDISANLDRCATLPGGTSQYLTVTWHPDGSAALFTAQDQGNVHLYRVPKDGGAVEPLTWRRTRSARQRSSFTMRTGRSID